MSLTEKKDILEACRHTILTYRYTVRAPYIHMGFFGFFFGT